MSKNISGDFTLWTEWKIRWFDGNINYPMVNRANPQDEVFYSEFFSADVEICFV